jgi:hypothetical protein
MGATIENPSQNRWPAAKFELIPKAVADGAEFDLLTCPLRRTCGHEVARLLRVYLDEKTGRQVAAYCGVDEAAAVRFRRGH